MGNIAETTWFEEQLENMEDDFPFLVNPEFDDFDWDTPINEQSWYTQSTEIDLDRDVPDNPNEPTFEDWPTDSPNESTFEDWVESMIGEPEYLGNR